MHKLDIWAIFWKYAQVKTAQLKSTEAKDPVYKIHHFCFVSKSNFFKRNNWTFQENEDNNQWFAKKMCCFNDWMVISNLIISLVLTYGAKFYVLSWIYLIPTNFSLVPTLYKLLFHLETLCDLAFAFTSVNFPNVATKSRLKLTTIPKVWLWLKYKWVSFSCTSIFETQVHCI